MTYGNKFIIFILLLSFLFIVGCEEKVKNFQYGLYDGYVIKGINGSIMLYKEDKPILIEEKNYQIKEIKYNNDVVCLRLLNDKYYMIYYVDGSIFGPFTKESLDKTIKEDSTLIFTKDFQDITKMEGLEYE